MSRKELQENANFKAQYIITQKNSRKKIKIGKNENFNLKNAKKRKFKETIISLKNSKINIIKFEAPLLCMALSEYRRDLTL